MQLEEQVISIQSRTNVGGLNDLKSYSAYLEETNNMLSNVKTKIMSEFDQWTQELEDKKLMLDNVKYRAGVTSAWGDRRALITSWQKSSNPLRF